MSERVSRCILFTNGMVMTFGPDHQQIPELQGPFAAIRARLWDAGVRDVEYARWLEGNGEAVGMVHLVQAEDGAITLMPGYGFEHFRPLPGDPDAEGGVRR